MIFQIAFHARFQIDFGEGAIDFGNDVDFGDIESATEVTLETGDIDWGAVDESNAGEIDFDISVKDSGITIESSGIEGGVAKNHEALTVIDSPTYREQFLDELFEVNMERSFDIILMRQKLRSTSVNIISTKSIFFVFP